MVNYQLKPATEADTNWLEALRRKAYRDLFDATWGGWDEERHQRHFQSQMAGGSISIIERNGKRVGMVQLFKSAAHVKVGEIQILPECQNAGVGRYILEDIIQTAHRSGKHVQLSLGIKNEAALRLYERLGFAETKRDETHIYMVCSIP